MSSAYLSNHWNDVTLLKLDPGSENEGPYCVVQDAIDSNDPQQVRRIWILRRDGKWIDWVLQMALKPEEHVPAWFHSIAEVMECLGSLPVRPLVLRKTLTDEEKAQSLAKIEGVSIESIRVKVREWRDAQRDV